MVKKKRADKATEQIRIYPLEFGIIRRLAFRKNTTAAEVIRSLIKGV